MTGWYGVHEMAGPKKKAPKKEGPVSRASFHIEAAIAYQITMRLPSPRTMGSVGLHENAAANSGMLDGAPIARNVAGACSLVLTMRSSSSGVYCSRHTVPQLRKKRWSRDRPSAIGSGVPSVALCIAAYATLRPP